MAKKGDPEKMVHHFAHDKKAKQDQEEAVECEYSFCVVARLVIKQCFRELGTFEIVLPEWNVIFTENDNFGREHTVTGYVTQAHNLKIDKFEVEPSAPFHELDILCHVNGYPIGFHFSYHGRPDCVAEGQSGVSIVDIDLEPLKLLYNQYDGKRYDSFKDLVMDYVLKTGKRYWLAHVRYVSREKELKAKLADMIGESNMEPPALIAATPSEQLRFNPKPYKKPRKSRGSNSQKNTIVRSLDGLCVRCHQNSAAYINDLICAPCLQHYYSVGIFHTGSIKKAVKEEFFS
ncbi:hypothetical protein [Vibrio sp. HA2012]|uniref:hypothetical protein n=1 Tax=Vibrio sp. HA2012 TaxID=1971595 RepID=UPI001E3E37BE|nr:hypothetical protein [Vibrio sp. HA2012]